MAKWFRCAARSPLGFVTTNAPEHDEHCEHCEHSRRTLVHSRKAIAAVNYFARKRTRAAGVSLVREGEYLVAAVQTNHHFGWRVKERRQ